MNELVELHNGEPRVSSEVIADHTGNEHRAVLQLIRNNLADFETFGRVAFEMRPFETAGGTQKRTIAHLNEPQSTLLITYMRNNERVREFKKALVTAFYSMRAKLTQPAQRELTKLEALEMAIESEKAYQRELKARQAIETYARELEPKADAYDRFLDADGAYSVGVVAKMLGLSQNKLFDRLRGAGVLISKGHMRNTPYQKYMHHFAVNAFDYERSNGERGVKYTTKVLPSGIEFISRKLGITSLGIGLGEVLEVITNEAAA